MDQELPHSPFSSKTRCLPKPAHLIFFGFWSRPFSLSSPLPPLFPRPHPRPLRPETTNITPEMTHERSQHTGNYRKQRSNKRNKVISQELSKKQYFPVVPYPNTNDYLRRVGHVIERKIKKNGGMGANTGAV